LLERRRADGRPLRRRPWHLETHWFQCLLYPFLAWRLLIGLAGALALATVWLVQLTPELQPPELDGTLIVTLLMWPVRLMIPLALLAYGCAFLQCVLNAAVAGDPPHVYWPGRYVHIALLYVGRWAYCFLAGPMVPAAAALLYWLNCGDMDFLDVVILAELGVLTVGYLLFALLVAARTDRALDATPRRVGSLMRRLGYRSAVAIVVASLLAYWHGRLLLGGMAAAHGNAFGGWLLLTVAWLSALASATFLFRIVGLWCYRCAGKAA
jgi:hypothetical protein